MSASDLADVQSQRRLQSEEELLAFQAQFQSGAVQSSTKVIRAVRNKPAATATAAAGAAPVEEEHKASSTSATVATPAASSSASTLSEHGEAALVFPGGHAIAERGHVDAPHATRASFVQSSASAARTGFPVAFRGGLTATPTAAAAPQPRAYNAPVQQSQQPEKKKSLFAQQRDRMLQQQREAAAVAGAAPASVGSASAALATLAVSAPAPAAAAASIRDVVAVPTMLMTGAAAAAAAAAVSSPPPVAAAAAPSQDPEWSAWREGQPLPKPRGIDVGNLDLDSMTEEEIAESQRQLVANLEKMDPALLAFFRSRQKGGASSSASSALGAGFAPRSSAAAPAPTQAGRLTREYPEAQQLDDDMLSDAQHDTSDSDSDDEGLDEQGLRVSRVKERIEQDAALDSYSSQLEARQQALKLEWTEPLQATGAIAWPTDVQGYQNDGEAWNSFRVDLDGRFIGEQQLRQVRAEQQGDEVTVSTVDYDDERNALYHHGDQADRPGYTMREILHLVRSTVMSQRTLSLQVLAKVLARIRQDDYSYPAPVRATPRGSLPASALLDAVDETGSTPSFSHLLFSHLLYLNLATLLRLALDDNRNSAGILAALHGVQAMVFVPRVNITMALDQQANYKGHQLARRFEEVPLLVSELNLTAKKITPGAQEEDESGTRPEEADPDQGSDNAKDEDLCGKDLIVGLARMQLLERMRYILEVFILPAVQHRANPPVAALKGTAATDAMAPLVLLTPVVSILLAFVQHSPQAASKVFDTPRLKEVLVKVALGLVSIVSSGRVEAHSTSIVVLGSALQTLLLVFGNLCQIHREIAFFFIKSGVLSGLRMFVVLANGVPDVALAQGGVPSTSAGLEVLNTTANYRPQLSDEESLLMLPISIQALHMWRVCLSYGLDIEAFMDHHKVLLGIVAGTEARLKATCEGDRPGVNQLWLRQLCAACSVIEGLTLLFLPNATSPATVAAGASYSAPPGAISFELSHVVLVMEEVLKALPSLFEAETDGVTVDTRTVMQETLAGFLHLIATYYSVLPLQSSFDDNSRALLNVQVEKHLSSFFSGKSSLLTDALQIMREADEHGVQWIAQQDASHRPALAFSNIPISMPSNEARVLQQSLNVWFGLVRWQESLTRSEAKLDAQQKQRMLAATRDTRDLILKHFFAPNAQTGVNRIHARDQLLSGMESELAVTLLVLSRESPWSVSPAGFYQSVLQLLPTLLRNGQQFLVSKLHADVLFNSSVLQSLERGHATACAKCDLPRPVSSPFTFTACKLLHDLYVAFSYFPEELLVSTLLHTHSILTPTLCVPIALPSNIIAQLDTSTGSRFCVTVPQAAVGLGGATQASAVWLLNMISREKFLAVQLEKKAANTKLATVVTILTFLRTLDAALGVFTSPPAPSTSGAHSAATLFFRALMELYLLGGDIFLEGEFKHLIGHFSHQLLDIPASSSSALQSERFIGVPNHAVSTLMFGASITAPGKATIRTQGTQMVKLVSPEGQGVPAEATSSSSSSSSALASLRPYFDFHSGAVPSSVWGTSFYPFFKEFVSKFISDSWGEENFARILLVFLRQEYAIDFRLVMYRECCDLMQTLDVQLPVDDLGFLFPYETNNELLQMLISYIAGVPAVLTYERNPSLYLIALHHVSIHLFGWEHVSGSVEMSALDRNQRLKDMMPMTLSPKCRADLHLYRFKATLAIKAAADAFKPKPQSDSPAPAAAVLCNSSSSSSPPASSATPIPMSARTPLSLSAERLDQIASTRAAARARGPMVRLANCEYGLRCPCCDKPNALSVRGCTGCSFSIVEEDEVRLPSNIFLSIVNGEPEATDNTVAFRGERDGREYLVIDDKYGSSDHHLDCIPAEVFIDISVLGREHITMLETMYALGRQVLVDRAVPWIPSDVPVDDVLTAGYNYPVSVKHLHLHMALAPYYHDRVFSGAGVPVRWHSHQKVVEDLRTYGKVQLNQDVPNQPEWDAVYTKAIATSRRAAAWKADWEAKQ